MSQSALDDALARLALRFPALSVIPTVGDFAAPLALPARLAKRPRLGFFPGSTIGNFAPPEARGLLGDMAATLGRARQAHYWRRFAQGSLDPAAGL